MDPEMKASLTPPPDEPKPLDLAIPKGSPPLLPLPA